MQRRSGHPALAQHLRRDLPESGELVDHLLEWHTRREPLPSDPLRELAGPGTARTLPTEVREHGAEHEHPLVGIIVTVAGLPPARARPAVEHPFEREPKRACDLFARVISTLAHHVAKVAMPPWTHQGRLLDCARRGYLNTVMLASWLKDLLDVSLHLGLAYLLALPVGWERDRMVRSAGLRTFALVALGSCAYVLLARRAFGDSPEAQARVIQGLITGMGFVGGGVILKGKKSVRGLATAASIWNTGAIGAAVALDHVALAIVLSLVDLITLHVLARGRSKEPLRSHHA
ncbi:MAG: MgtC/SapB family protein [Myxococcales bacterium]